MEIVDKIRMLCESKGITMTSLENMLHFGGSTIRRWNAQSPYIDKVLKVANYFNVPVDYLLGNSKYSDLDKDFPQGVQILRRANNELTENDKEKMIKIIQAFLDN